MTQDVDPFETQEWLDAFDSVCKAYGEDRATFLLDKLQAHASGQGIKLPSSVTTPYQHDYAAAGKAHARRSFYGATYSLVGTLERAGHGDESQ